MAVRPEYLEKGLLGLSRAHLANTMTGYLGATLVAGYLLSEEHRELDRKVHAGIEKELDRVLNGESVFDPGEGGPIATSELFVPYPDEAMQVDQIDRIAQVLSGNIGETRSSGHNVIFASLSIRALQEYPRYATSSVIDGICRLIGGFDRASAGSGYYGREKGRIDGDMITLPEHSDFPPYSNPEGMIEAVLDELLESAAERRQGYGGLWHVINHAASLIDLSECGYADLAQKGLEAHHRNVRLWRSLPNVEDELGTEEPAEEDPCTPVYWECGALRRDRARLTHRIKTLYGFHRLTCMVEDTTRLQRARDALRYLM
ncbi:MAG: hypothetical protein OXU79_13080 [Gemmatimonadota bacterium]|nr:hypothetical protein [Gemmatimonadota bacterium]